jgi:hypothetical protein
MKPKKTNAKAKKYKAVGWMNQYNHYFGHLWQTREQAERAFDWGITPLRTVRVYIEDTESDNRPESEGGSW